MRMKFVPPARIMIPARANLRSHVEEPKIRALDAAYESTLGVKTGDEMTFVELKKRIAEKVSDQAFQNNCSPCSWKSLGYCKSALETIRKTYLPLILIVALCSFSAEAGHKKNTLHAKNKKSTSKGCRSSSCCES